ncbi:hypothetical protein ASD25_11050 [Brevundimonas sp. Root1423]|nr:hypothetical protein ASD25_11050 [Brevundimonas sp. Root1423]
MPTDRIQQVVRVSQETFVCKPQDGEPGFRQLQVPLGVFDLSKAMDAAIELNHELELRTEKIGYRPGHRRLASKLQAFELPSPQHLPQTALRTGHVGAKTTRLAGSVFRLVQR